MGPLSPVSVAPTENGSQLVGLRAKSGPVEIEQDRAGAQRDPFEDLRKRVRDRRHLGGGRVDVDRDPDHDVAEVIGARDGRGDDREAQRRAFVWTRRGRPCRRRRGDGCRRRRRPSRCRPGWPRDMGGPARRGRCSRAGELRERRLGAVGNPFSVARSPGGVLTLEPGEVLVAVGAGQLEARTGSARRRCCPRVPGLQRGVEGTGRARAGRAVRARVDGEEAGSRSGSGSAASQGTNSAVDRIGAALGRRRRRDRARSRRSGALNSWIGAWGRFGELIDDLPGLRVEADRAGELHVGREAVRGEEEPVACCPAAAHRCRRRPGSAPAARSCRSSRCRPSRIRGTALRSSVPKSSSVVGAGGLAVGGVRIDRRTLPAGSPSSP